jgi:hypothetical protein
MLPLPQEHDLDALAAFAEQRLDESARAGVIEHLATCGQCRATLAAISRARTGGVLAPAPAAEPQASGATQARPGWRGVPAWAALAASLALVTFAWVQLRPPVTDTGEELLLRRGAERIVNGKNFHLESDTWVDSAFDPKSDAPAIVVRGAEERMLLTAQNPELAEFADLGSRVIVVWEGKVYRFEP